jgi:hypothetical protein
MGALVNIRHHYRCPRRRQLSSVMWPKRSRKRRQSGVVSADGSTQLGDTLASDRTFDYASRAKATWKRDFRLKYKANMIYLPVRLKRSTGIEWDDYMKANTTTHALDKIVYGL